MHHVDARHLLQQFTGEMPGRTGAGVGEDSLPGLALP
jgi:hypothetical protein